MIKQYNDNPIVRYINDVMSQNQNKKIILYGCGTAGARIYAYLAVLGYEVSYFIDMDENKHGMFLDGKYIKSPYDLLYEANDYLIFLCIIDNAILAEQLLNGIGLQENVDYFNIMKYWGGRSRYDIYDPICGYSRNGDLTGFSAWGNKKSKNKILILGGSTTDDDYSAFASWVKYFYDIIKNDYNNDIVIYNGAISGYESSQELLKFLRDGIWLKPNIVIQFNGVNEVDIDIKHPLVNKYLQYMCKNKFSNIIGKDTIEAPKIGLRSAENLELSFGLEINAERHENWAMNMRIMKAICGEFNIMYYGILQPTSMFGNHKDELIRKVNKILKECGNIKLEARKEFYENITTKHYLLNGIHDLSNIFKNVEGSLYFDEVHYTEKANKILAESIYDLVKDNIVRK